MIQRRDFYYVEIILDSPLSLGNGVNNNTDQDILVDKEGKPFIPGTSLAGVFTDYIKKCHIDDEETFQPKRNDQNLQSPVFFSDSVLKSEFKKDTRDGIKLKDEQKLTEDGAKYDFEIVDIGTKFVFRIEITHRKNEDIKYREYVEECLKAMDEGSILLGAKTTRGLGRVKITLLKHRSFTKENAREYIQFTPYNEFMYEDYSLDNVKLTPLYATIKLDLKLNGGISIRKYNANAQEEDFHHITNKNNQPIIPGTSWNGMIKKQFKYYFETILGHNENETKALFGFVDSNSKNKQKSQIIIEEHIIDGGEEVVMTRNSIDRFSGGTVERRLFTERTHYYGQTQLVIRIPQKLMSDDIMSAFECIIQDIDNGFIALGGQTAVGRGLFKVVRKEGI